ncbi:CPBP family intramembrane glutamic endopeptidase [Labrys sp. 22185]|uniref:CPBP family intramembrane glutamic endopeptidase n=1 Tax=Labrys sp. 22185 TaxID=3453888 RepID=UPI003F848B92
MHEQIEHKQTMPFQSKVVSSFLVLIAPIGLFTLTYGLSSAATEIILYFKNGTNGVIWYYFDIYSRYIPFKLPFYGDMITYHLQYIFVIIVVIAANVKYKFAKIWKYNKNLLYSFIFIAFTIASPFISIIPQIILTHYFSIGFGNSPALFERLPLFVRGADVYIFSSIIILYISIIVPIAEELSWRGFVVEYLKYIGINEKTILIFVSLIFALAHLPRDVGILFPISIFPFALCITWARLKSGGIFWPILMHASANGALTVFPIATMIRHSLYG